VKLRKSATRLTLCGLLALSFPALAQQPKKLPRIGYVTGAGPEGYSVEAFRQALRQLGYVEGKNIVVQYRYGEGDLSRLSQLVSELVRLKADILVITALPAIRAAKEATKRIPIVMVTNVDPVATGTIDSLARPGGNVTGLTLLNRDLSGKRLELLREVFPNLSRVGILWSSRSPENSGFKEYETAARALKIEVQSLEVRQPNPDLDGVLKSAPKGHGSALITIRNPLFNRYTKHIADLAIQNRLASMFEWSQYVEAGGLISYATDENYVFGRAAVYVDKIIKGAKPADLPVEQPTKFELVINLNTAKQIGLTIPPNVLARADRVIK